MSDIQVQPVTRPFSATITPPGGGTPVTVQQTVSVSAHSTKTVSFSPSAFPSLTISHPQVWWPYQMGPSPLYTLDTSVSQNGTVSDATTVLAKATIPFAILPLLSFGVVVVAGFVMLLVSSLILAANGLSAAPLWTELYLVRGSLLLLYHLITVHVLWYAPIYAWLMFVSAWSRRAALLWAVLPPLGVGFLERIVFGTSHLGAMLLDRVGGSMAAVQPAGTMPMNPMTHLTPWNFFVAPGLWIGWLITAVFLAAAIRIRRNREPIMATIWVA